MLARTECDRERWADAAYAKYLARLGPGPPYLKITPDSSIKRLSKGRSQKLSTPNIQIANLVVALDLKYVFCLK